VSGTRESKPKTRAQKKKTANGTGRPRANEASENQPLTGCECSRRGDQAAESTRDESNADTLSPGGSRMPNQPSGQVAAPTRGTARVGFEFAGRAHRREFTPNLEIKRKENIVKEKEEDCDKKARVRNERRKFNDEMRRRSPHSAGSNTGQGPGGPSCLPEISIRSEVNATPPLRHPDGIIERRSQVAGENHFFLGKSMSPGGTLRRRQSSR
jgi:hypothetical protein